MEQERFVLPCPLFSFSQPLHYLLSYTDCSCLIVVIQGDFPPLPSEQRGLGGIFECQGCWLLALQHLLRLHPRLIHPCFCCQTSGIWLVMQWLAASLDILKSQQLWLRPVLSLWEAEKSLQCFSMCAALARSCVLLISCSYFEYWPSLLYVHISCRSASENANEAAANISHHMCSAHTEESVTGAQINMTTSLF